MQQTNEQSGSRQQNDEPEEILPPDVENFLLSHPETGDDDTAIAKLQRQTPTKSEMFEAVFSPFHLLSALLSRDKTFASAIGSQPLVTASVLEVVNDDITVLLDAQYVSRSW